MYNISPTHKNSKTERPARVLELAVGVVLLILLATMVLVVLFAAFSGAASQTSKEEFGHDNSGGSGDENLEDFQSLEHLAYLEHTEYRTPTRNIGWGENEEEKEILRQIFDELEITTKLASNFMEEDLTELSSATTFEELSEETTGKTTSAGSKLEGNSSKSGETEMKSTTAEEGAEIKSTTEEGSEIPMRSTGSSFNNWQSRVHFVTKEPISPIDAFDEEESAKEPPTQTHEKEPTRPSSDTNSNPWRIRFEVEERPQTNIGNSLVGSPEFEVSDPIFGSPEFEVSDPIFGSTEFEVSDPIFGSPEFEVTDQKASGDTSTTFPSSIEIFETMPPCDTEFCE